jgi:AraC family transcriptional regulator
MVIEPNVVDMPGFTVVGLAITTRPLASEIPALWGQFAPRMDEVLAIAEPGVSYGVMDNFDPGRSTMDYMAAVSVISAGRIPGGMVARSIGPGTYAVFPATLGTLSDVFGYIFGAWAQHASLERARAPYFERYDESFDPGNAASKVEIYIPVQPRNVLPSRAPEVLPPA